LKSALYQAPAPRIEPPIVIGALNPRMLELAGRESDGAITYFLPPAHTAKARAAMGPNKWVCAEQAVMLERDAAKARAAARTYMKIYLTFPAYLNNLRLHGFGDDDFASGGSDRLVDAVVAWGDERKLHERLEAHRNAGANHVCILPLGSGGGLVPDERVIEALAPL
ncbi:MAG: LLM class flavin-dependent oxidoreductase, partial [Pseudomonadota bacterium]